MCQWWLAMLPYRSWERATVGEAYCFSAPLAGPSRWKGLSAMLLSQPQVSRHAHRQWCFETGRHLLLTALHTFHPHILPYWPWSNGWCGDSLPASCGRGLLLMQVLQHRNAQVMFWSCPPHPFCHCQSRQLWKLSVSFSPGSASSWSLLVWASAQQEPVCCVLLIPSFATVLSDY